MHANTPRRALPAFACAPLTALILPPQKPNLFQPPAFQSEDWAVLSMHSPRPQLEYQFTTTHHCACWVAG